MTFGQFRSCLIYYSDHCSTANWTHSAHLYITGTHWFVMGELINKQACLVLFSNYNPTLRIMLSYKNLKEQNSKTKRSKLQTPLFEVRAKLSKPFFFPSQNPQVTIWTLTGFIRQAAISPEQPPSARPLTKWFACRWSRKPAKRDKSTTEFTLRNAWTEMLSIHTHSWHELLYLRGIAAHMFAVTQKYNTAETFSLMISVAFSLFSQPR